MKLGIDIGGTNIKCALIEKNTILEHYKFSTDTKFSTGTEFIENIVLVISKLINPNITSIGISTAGNVNPKNGIILSASDSIPHYSGTNIKKIFEKKFEITTFVDNDVNCGLIGEVEYSGIRDDSLMITIGTGIGGALFLNNSIFRGYNNSSAQLGFCLYSGHRWEVESSTKNLILRARKVDKSINSGEDLLNKRGTTDIESLLDSFYSDIALGLMNSILLINPANVRIGGGITENEFFDIKQIEHKINILLPEHLQNKITVNVTKTKLGNLSSAYGATFLENYY